MDTNQFRQIIRTEYGYQSPERRLFLARHLPGWRTFIYYARIVLAFVIARLDGLQGKLTNARWLKASIRCVKAVESAGGRLHVSGLEAVSQYKGPLIFIANHMSILETIILPAVILTFKDVTFIIKDELRQYPLIGRVMKVLNLIAVYRRNPREDLKIVLNEGHNRIRQGCSVVIFPQATRSQVFDEKIFNTLGVKLARKAGVPVVPIALKTDFHGNGQWIKDIGPINPDLVLYFKFGKPMPVTGNGHAAQQRVVEFITQNLQQWGAEIRINSG
ncbi:MAG: lysophospholipid acyltransferase family protein [Desulfobacterales bacterium]|jgi:1-acyl-sn-glycerol-3-phosphate acyltransferase